MITYSSPKDQPIPAVPVDIALAIAQIKKAVKTIEKDAENKHGNYEYASVDAVYEAVRVAMADQALGLMLLEVDFGPVGEKSARFVFQWILFTDKSTWTHPSAKRSIILPWNGPQTAQAAQSYVEKAILKSLFKLNTGDAEPEGNELGAEPPKGKKTDSKKAEKATVDPQKAEQKVKEILADLEVSYPIGVNAQDANDFAEKWGADLADLPDASKQVIREALKSRRVQKS